MKKNVLLAAHYTPTPGPMDKLESYLINNDYTITFFRYPLYPKSKLPITITTAKKEKKLFLPWYLQYFLEGISTFLIYSQSFKKKNFHLAICGDPLAFLHHYLLKRLYRIETLVYFNVDFSTQRYKNEILNLIYQKINSFAYFKSDYCISLTPHFFSHVDKQQTYPEKQIVITHWINISDINRKTKKIKNSLIYAGSLTKGLNFEPVFQSLLKLRKKKIPFVLDIYGDGGEKKILMEKVKQYELEKSVTFKGIVDNTELTKNILPKYRIGICPYIQKDEVAHADHMFQGVSLTTKLVEYIAAGLPIIATPLTESFQVIADANFGFLPKTTEDWYNAITTLLMDDNVYKKSHRNALEYAQRFDEEKVLGEVLNKIN